MYTCMYMDSKEHRDDHAHAYMYLVFSVICRYGGGSRNVEGGIEQTSLYLRKAGRESGKKR